MPSKRDKVARRVLLIAAASLTGGFVLSTATLLVVMLSAALLEADWPLALWPASFCLGALATLGYHVIVFRNEIRS